MLRLLLMHAFTWMPLGCWCCLRVLVLHRFPAPAHPRIPASRQRVLEKCAQRRRPGCQDVTPTPTPTIQISARKNLRTRGSRRVSHCLLKHFQLRKQVHINIDHFFVSRLITWLNRHVRACSSWSSRLPHWLSREQVGWQSQPRAGYTLVCWRRANESWKNAPRDGALGARTSHPLSLLLLQYRSLHEGTCAHVTREGSVIAY